MADNIILSAGTADGATLATDDIAGVHYQLVKQVFGALDTATLVSTSTPLPVDLRADNLAGNLDVNIAASGATVAVSHATLAVTGGGAEGTALRVTIANDSTGVVSVDDNGGSLTIDGAVSISSLPDEGQQTMANSISVAIASDQSALSVTPSAPATNRTAAGALGALNATVVVSAEGTGTVHWEIDAGTLVGTVVFEATLDDTAWFAINAIRIGGTIISSTTTFADRGALDSGGYSQVRLRVSAYTSGTSNARLEASAGTALVRLGQALPAGTNNIGDVDVATVPAPLSTSGGGTEATALRVTIANDSTGVVSVDDNGGSLTVDNATLAVTGGGTEATALRVTIANDSTGVVSVDDNGGSLTIDGSVSISSLPNEGQQTMANSISVAVASDQSNVPVSQATASSLNAQVVGNVAHDGADSGNPVGVGGTGRTTNPTAVADGDRVRIFCDDLGKLVTYPYAPRDRVVHNRITLTSTTETTLIAAGSAGVFRDLVGLYLSNEAATEVRVDIRDSSGGTVRFSLDLATDGGGAAIVFPVPLTQATAANAWTAQLSAAVSTVYLTALAVENN